MTTRSVFQHRPRMTMRGERPLPPASSPSAIPNAEARDRGGKYHDADEDDGGHPQPVTPTKKKLDESRTTAKKKRGGGIGGGVRETNPRMIVPKAIVDELLLVCGVIGSKQVVSSSADDKQDNGGQGVRVAGGEIIKFVPVTDCLNWLQDLQRALRRDDDSYRPVSLLLGKWRVVSQKLIPLVLSCRYDTPLVLTVVKILVILTKPMSDEAKRAGRLVVDVTSGKTPESVVREQIKLRENAIAQSNQLLEYKRLFTRHPSHNCGKSDRRQQRPGGLLSIFVSLLAEPLSKVGTDRTDADHLTVELVLHLFRNLLSAEPILLSGSVEKTNDYAVLHHDLISLFEGELVLDVLLVLAQDMESRENAPYNLLLMEILHHLFRGQDPTQVARTALLQETTGGGGDNSGNTDRSAPRDNAAAESASSLSSSSGRRTALLPPPRSGPTGSGSLRSLLQKERRRLSSVATARHSHFGGTLVTLDDDGTRRYVSAGALTGHKSAATATGGGGGGVPPRPRRKNRKLDAFIGSGLTSASHSREGLSVQSQRGYGPLALRARAALHAFCARFVDKCYGPVMKSLKNEFRRDSVRLEEGDRAVFFRIVWFFCQWWRVWKLEGGEGSAGTERRGTDNVAGDGSNIRSAIGKLIFTMDVFTYNLVLNATEMYHQRKRYGELAQAVALYSEMMQLLWAMYSSEDPTENVMALGLMDRLFYGAEPTDRLPKLLSRWAPGSNGREYLCDLVELTHVTLKLLESNAASCTAASMDAVKSGKGGRRGKKSKSAEEQKRQDAVSRMNATAAEFDVTSYLVKKIVSNQVVFMFTRLLSLYSVNSSRINQHLVSFMLRLCTLTIAMPEVDEGEGGLSNPIALKATTLEPMLYNIQTLTVLNDILNDDTIQDEPDFDSLLNFSTVVMRHFSKAAEANPMLFVECLFKHPVPHRFCELVLNNYVTEELRMMAERELLLEEQRRMAEAEERSMEGDDAESAAADDEELEFVDEDIIKSKNESGRVEHEDDSSSVEKEQATEEETEFVFEETECDDKKDEKANFDVEVRGGGSQETTAHNEQKRKRNGFSKDEADDFDEDDGAEDVDHDGSEKTNLSGKFSNEVLRRGKRIKRKALLDDVSSDEDDMFAETEVLLEGTHSSSQLVFDDDEDD